MTQDEIIEMARKVGLCRTQANFDDWIDAGPTGYELEEFAKLVLAKERDDLCKYFQELEDKATSVRDKIYLSGVQNVIKQRNKL